jgi:hypothetical protein
VCVRVRMFCASVSITDYIYLEGCVSGLIRYYLGISLYGLKELTVNLSKVSQCPGRHSNRAYPEYKVKNIYLLGRRILTGIVYVK